MTPPFDRRARVFIDLTHVGRHVTGIERIAIEQFEKASFEDANLRPVKASGVVAMIFKQQVVLPLIALLNPQATFVFPGFPPSPVFALLGKRVVLYVHDTFLLTRRSELSTKARLYMAPQFSFALRHLKRFLVNSEKTAKELKALVGPDANVALYRPIVRNIFLLEASGRSARPSKPAPLKLVILGTIEPRKNYAAAAAILDALRKGFDPAAELHVIGRPGWQDAVQEIAGRPGVTLHGYLPPKAAKGIIESADLYLCTSRDEGLGLPLLEAQFAGLPVVAPDGPVFREVLGPSGTFIDPARPGDAAGKIAALIAPPGWRANAIEAALANIGRWNAAAEGDLATIRKMFARQPVTLSTSLPAHGRAR